MVRRYINLADTRDDSSPPVSDAVLAGSTLYVAGQVGADPATGKAPADVNTEIALLLDNVSRVLEVAGMTMDDLVSVQVFCPDLSLFDRFNSAYRARFRKELPARAFIGSGPLLLDARFEMLGIAVKR